MIRDVEDFRALDPFFRIIEQGLQGLADGGHFFELLADDVVFDFVITVPDHPRRVVGRDNLIELLSRLRLHVLPRPLRRPTSAPFGFDFLSRARIRVSGQSRRDGLPIQQQIHLRAHTEGPQSVALARLPRPAARLCCTRRSVEPYAAPVRRSNYQAPNG